VKYDFPYDDIAGVDIPDSHEVTPYSVKVLPDAPADEEKLISDSIAAPIGMERISKCLGTTSRVLIVVDDISRPTPIHRVLPPLLKEIHSAGVSEKNVRFLIALGTHRPMTPAEIDRKCGRSIARRYEVINHAWANPLALHHYGRLAEGTEVILNKAMSENDFVIGVGGIAPHPAAGFSGGGKIIAPGVATEEAVGEFHWNSVQIPQADVLGVRDNPMRDQIDRIADLAGLKAIVNVIQDGKQRIVKVVTGHPVEAHKAGCRFALDLYGIDVPRPAEAGIFIADTHPLDQDLWQGVKAMCALDCIAPDGAVVILVTPSPEGVSQQHPELLEHGYVTLEEGRRLVAGGVSKVAAHNMVQGGRLVRRTRAFMVSAGIPPDQIERMGFTVFATVQQAFDAARKIKGDRAKVIILGMGGEICPIAKP
jgi:nickel-dependent lactate racemase